MNPDNEASDRAKARHGKNPMKAPLSGPNAQNPLSEAQASKNFNSEALTQYAISFLTAFAERETFGKDTVKAIAAVISRTTKAHDLIEIQAALSMLQVVIRREANALADAVANGDRS